uniref:Uncharacterized protein n=1 Tax=Arundo donax TaxID=35708 RepID=A0A0A9DKQ1_ARUDO
MDRAALRMLSSPQFWRMAVLWTLSILHSYLLLLRGRAASPPRRRPGPGSSGVGGGGGRRRPICVVTGATSGLGRAAASALAREGYHVVLGQSRCLAWTFGRTGLLRVVG